MDYELPGRTVSVPTFDESFTHNWQAEILPARPAILPARHYVYPQQAEEVERGALEVMVRPGTLINEKLGQKRPPCAQQFLATCALGFRDPAVPTGLWSAPDPDQICAVAGGYAYLIDTSAPERFTMIPYRPVLELRAAVEAELLLFVGHRSILAWDRDGQAWESERLSDEGVTIIAIEGLMLHGMGWHILSDKEIGFALDLRSGICQA